MGYPLLIDNQKIGVTERYKYLGSIINSRGTQSDDINNRLHGTSGLFYVLNNRKFLRNGNISRATKIKIYLLTLLYGCENWVLTETQTGRLEAAQMKYLRGVAGLRITDKIRSSIIREDLNIKNINVEIERRKLGWFGHLARMKDEKPAKRIWLTRATERNRRGRPRRT